MTQEEFVKSYMESYLAGESSVQAAVRAGYGTKGFKVRAGGLREKGVRLPLLFHQHQRNGIAPSQIEKLNLIVDAIMQDPKLRGK